MISLLELEEAAMVIRKDIRAKAGLSNVKPSWNDASDSMQEWYRYLAIERLKDGSGTVKDNS